MQTDREFVGWPKIPRVGKAMSVVVTEKVDGTNSQIVIENGEIVAVGSRKRWINPKSDNYGFAGWVERNKEELLGLENGSHFGEYYGLGIQHGYGMKEKRFALFNNFRWDNPSRPAICDVVPTLYKGEFYPELVNDLAEKLRTEGSTLVPGWMKPEGFILYFPEFRQSAKWTFEHQDGKWKD